MTDRRTALRVSSLGFMMELSLKVMTDASRLTLLQISLIDHLVTLSVLSMKP
jgi:hypothetical protein